MKVAILFHGHLRSFRKTCDSFNEKVVSPILQAGHSVELFMHTWDKEEFDTKTWHKGARDIVDTNLHEVEKLYGTKNILCETQKINNPNNIIFGRPYEALKLVWYSFYKAWFLMHEHEKTNGAFDVVIATRPDVYHYTDIFLDELENTDHVWQTQIFTKKAASDVVIYGARENIYKCLIGFYQRFDELHKPEKINNVTNNEYIFNDFLAKTVNVKTSRYCMPVNWRILRSWWNIDHKEGHRKWDRDLALKDINKNEKYKYFRIGYKND
tara:strand:- start:7694 stop:8497 length:804 start_codon:yes stop_codon:yes gene_type:complete